LSNIQNYNFPFLKSINPTITWHACYYVYQELNIAAFKIMLPISLFWKLVNWQTKWATKKSKLHTTSQFTF